MSRGFKANTFDPCVFNKYFHGDQLTILLYVDDLMISCVNRQGIDYEIDFRIVIIRKLMYTKVLLLIT